MTGLANTTLLDAIRSPEELRKLDKGALRALADELRQDVIEQVSKTGGHLGAGLGVVELTVALHYVFDTPRSKIVWDVSHQCYPHKILTGRRDRMNTLRQGGGLSGFTSRKESEYDPFGAAHSSTSVSAALGFAKARDLAGDDYDVIAVLGDGAASGGMIFEGLNNLGYLKTKMLVVLNDNHMSISPPAGALSDYLTELRSAMPNAEERGRAMAEGDGLPNFVGNRTMFDDLGVRYAGPFDGHDMDEMRRVMEAAKAYDGPLLVHVITRKGKGYAPAEGSADCYHGVAKFDVETGKQAKGAAGAPKYQDVYGATLEKLAAKDPKIVSVTPAMLGGSGLNKFHEAFPDRSFDVGIAEQHCVTFAAGLAAEGFRPFAAVYSTFLQRGYDQVVHDVAIQKLPVRFGIDRAGMVGADGVTHQGSYDLTYLCCLPDFVVMGPADEAELVNMTATAAAIDDRPSAIRYPRGEGTGVALPETPELLEIGRGRILREGTKIALLSFGTRLADVLAAADELAAQGIEATVADARFAKPIDDALVARLAREHEVLVTIEEAAIGGFSAQVVDSMHRQRIDGVRFRPMYLPDFFIDHDKPARQIEIAGLSASHIVVTALDALGAKGKTHLRAVPAE